jgi:hypothetical protein
MEFTNYIESIIRTSIGKEGSPVKIQGRLKFESFDVLFPATIYSFIQSDKKLTVFFTHSCAIRNHIKTHKMC